MRKVCLLIMAALFCLPAIAQYNTGNLKIAQPLSVEESSVVFNMRNPLEKKQSLDKLILYPIRANEVFQKHFSNLGDYTNLREAISKEQIKISEVSESGTVSQLYAENLSEDTIYVMSGEVVKGGKQDRVMAQDFIIAPGQKVDVAAFCVESGRWSQSKDGTQFKGYGNVVNNGVRKAVTEEKNQTQVWSEVAETTKMNDAESGTNTYNALENSKEYQDELNAYLDLYRGRFASQRDVVGVIAVSGDKVIGCDMFATNQIFNNTYDQLLHSYITEAITYGSKVTIRQEKVERYLYKILEDEEKQEEVVDDNGFLFDHNGNRLHITTY